MSSRPPVADESVGRAPPGADRLPLLRLRRMKLAAGLFLLVAVGLYALTFALPHGGSGATGFLRAGAEAGTVGGLADWFAVTALFRRPLGLPIPHTALIPTRKDALGRSLQAFVGSNFLAGSVVRERLVASRLPERAGRWLADPTHAARLADELAQAAAGGIRHLDADSVAGLADTVLRTAQERLPLDAAGPALGHLLTTMLDSGAHRPPLAAMAGRLSAWLDRDDSLKALLFGLGVSHDGFLGNRAINLVEAVLRDRMRELAASPDAATWATVDTALRDVAGSLRSDPVIGGSVRELAATVLSAPELRRAVRAGTAAAQGLLAGLLEERDGELRAQLASAVTAAGRRLASDEALRLRLEERLASLVVALVENYREEITAVISATVERWDGAETARRLELAAGRDLQFIRINGTVVGALAGLTIHALSLL